MEKYMELLQEYLNGRRNIDKRVFYLAGRIYRGINNDRFTYEDIEQKIFGGKTVC